MDFITKLPRTTKVFDTIWVIVEQLTKSAQFLTIQESYFTEKLADVYVCEINARHRVSVSIIPDHDVRFTSWFCQSFTRRWVLDSSSA